MSFEIGRDTLMALVAMAWADGHIDPREAAGVRRAAEQLGLGPEDRKAVDTALANRIAMSEVETLRMKRPTRVFTYAIASWMAELDGMDLPPQEVEALKLLGDRLGMSAVARDKARTLAREAAKRSGADPSKYDLMDLRAKLEAEIDKVGVD